MGRRAMIRNDAVWRDTDGQIIDCHEGCLLRVGDTFYWYGRTYRGNVDGIYGTGGAAFRCGLVCYRSEDLAAWTRVGPILEYPDEPSWMTSGTWHRPRVGRHPHTGEYVLWFFCLGTPGSAWVRDLVAVAERPEGPFRIVGEPTVSGLDVSGDLAIWQEPDGSSWLANGDWSRNGWVLPLADDLRDTSGPGVIALAAQPPDKRYEGVCLARYRGKWLYAGSAVEGLNASETTLAVADDPLGPYRVQGLISQEKTWGSQVGSFCYLAESDRLLVLCDRWLHDHAGQRVAAEQSAQLWLPLEFDPASEQGRLVYHDAWDPWQPA